MRPISLTYMEVPGVWVWTGLALFAELVPKLGLYIMAVLGLNNPFNFTDDSLMGTYILSDIK